MSDISKDKQSILVIIAISYNTTAYITSSSVPHKRLNIDSFSVGTADENGNEFVVVIVDTCTRWIELYPVKDLKAESIAAKLIEHFGRYGPPQEILTDQGTEYNDQLVESLMATSIAFVNSNRAFARAEL